jgi:heme A synthase
MNALRLSVLTAIVATLAAPLAAAAAPRSDTAVACTAPTRSLVERRVEEQAARGMPELIGFVHRTAPIYQLSVVDAVAWVDAERERRLACVSASARVAD